LTTNFVFAQSEQEIDHSDLQDMVTIQNTSKSIPGIAPGHESHGIVVPLPQRDDGKVWVGTITWISTEPIELGYRLKHDVSMTENITSDKLHILNSSSNNITYAIPNLYGITPQQSYVGSENFVADAVVLHSANSSDFIVTYSVDAIAKSTSNR
ncbi:MAG: hypothetical protein ACPKQO_00375, partial [Nitrososphaeraceae archaeon]